MNMIIISDSTGNTENVILKKILLTCGILSSLLYVVMNIFIPMYWEGYSSVSQTVSELSAVDAPTRSLWVPLGFIYTFLIIAFGWGIRISAHDNRRLRIAGSLMLIYGVVSIIWPFTPMHQREVIAAGGGTISDTLHIAMAITSVLFMLVAVIFGAAAFGKRFRIYSILTIVIFLVFGILTSLEAPGIDSNLPTPTIGIWERINIGAFLLWVVVLALILIQKEKATSSTHINVKTY